MCRLDVRIPCRKLLLSLLPAATSGNLLPLACKLLATVFVRDHSQPYFGRAVIH